MTEELFQTLLLRSESSTTDFKSLHYDFSSESKGEQTAKFIKDIISFANTIRTESAYIIVGVKEENGAVEELGLNKDYDDSLFQDKIKNKVHPIPKFIYSTFEYRDKKFGIFEIPISKYQEPITTAVKFKGLDPGRVYFRRGTMNDEAIGKEVIQIQRWLDSLPDAFETDNVQDKITELISKLTKRTEPLSSIASETLNFARKNKLPELKKKSLIELQGWKGDRKSSELPNQIGYRKIKVLVSVNEFEFNPYMQISGQELFNHIKEQDGVFEQPLIWPDSLTSIERLIERYKNGKSIIATFSSTAAKVFPSWNSKDGSVHIYVSQAGLESMYESVRQTLIDELLTGKDR